MMINKFLSAMIICMDLIERYCEGAYKLGVNSIDSVTPPSGTVTTLKE